MNIVQVDNITISAPVTREFNDRLRSAVVARRVESKAEAIRQALVDWLNAPPCPQCDRATGAHPDGLMPGIWYCRYCEDAVIFSLVEG